MEFYKSNGSNKVLSFKGHEYLLQSDRSTAVKEVFRCRVHRQKKCHSVVHLRNGAIVHGPLVHSHPPDPVRAKANKIKSQIKEQAGQVGSTTRQILGSNLQNVPSPVRVVLPKKSSLERKVRAVRAKTISAAPNPTDRDFEIPEKYKPIILHDTFDLDPEDYDNRIIILGDKGLFKLLHKAETWFADGTFDAAPSMFGQLYSLHCKVGNKFPPVCYILLANKKETTYNRMCKILKDLLVDAKPKTILLDFEKAAHNAFTSVFRKVEVSGCYFHLTQSLVRNVQLKGLSELFHENIEFHYLVRCIGSLAFCPEQDVIANFEIVSDALLQSEDQAIKDEEDRIQTLLDYFENTYVQRNRRRATFPISLWNKYSVAKEGGPKTTNACEGWHQALNSLLLCKTPSIWRLLDGLAKDIGLNLQTVSEVRSGNGDPPNRKYKDLSLRFAEAVEQYDLHDNKLEYLQVIAALQ